MKRSNTRSLLEQKAFVKARIVGAAIPQYLLAREAAISNGALSLYLNGRLSSPATQLRIWESFCRLSGQKISLSDFWGELLSERIAS